MATLEKIRSKSVMLFIIIIVALLAFILGDFLTSGRTYFGQGMTVAKAGDVKVEYNDYQNRISSLSETARDRGQNVSSDQLSAQAINQLLQEGLLKKEYKDLGLTVTNDELSQLMYGPQNQHPQAAQTIAYLSNALGLNAPDAAAVHDAINNPVRYNLTQQQATQISSILSSMENDIENTVLSEKFGNLVGGLFTYNNLDAQAVYNDIATTRHLAYVSQDVSAVTDTAIVATEADVRALYNERKGTYRLDEPVRVLDYIMVRIQPSREDRINAARTVEQALLGLNSSDGLEAVAGDMSFSIENGSAPLSQVTDAALKNFLDTAAVNAAAIVERGSDSYTLAKFLAVNNAIDSINVSMVRAIESNGLDSVAAAINGGATAASFAADDMAGQDSIWMPLYGGAIPEAIVNSLTNATIGSAYVFADSVAGNFVFKVNKRHAPVKVYDFAIATYAVEPSMVTLDNLSSDLRTYVSNHSSAAEFADSAALAGYAVMPAEVTPSSVSVGRAEDSRRFVRWAMDAKKGQVSPVFQDDKQTYLIAMAVKDIYNDYRPMTDERVYRTLEGEALNNKKAASLRERYAGQASDLAGYAQLMGTEVAEGDVNFTQPMLLNLGFNESALQGAIAAAAEGQLVGPVQGKRGVVVFEVRSTDTANRPFDADEYGAQFMRSFSPMQSAIPFLLGKNKVTNRSLEFIANPAE